MVQDGICDETTCNLIKWRVSCLEVFIMVEWSSIIVFESRMRNEDGFDGFLLYPLFIRIIASTLIYDPLRIVFDLWWIFHHIESNSFIIFRNNTFSDKIQDKLFWSLTLFPSFELISIDFRSMDYSYENNFEETKIDFHIELITRKKKKKLYWNYDPFETRANLIWRDYSNELNNFKYFDASCTIVLWKK